VIVSEIHAESWGTDQLRDPEGNVIGAQINMKSGDQIWRIPWSTDSLVKLIKELSEGLTTEQRRTLAPSFTNGLFLPGQDFETGPQG
jgi:hypothetical protein